MFKGKSYSIVVVLFFVMGFFSLEANAQERNDVKILKTQKVKTYDVVIAELNSKDEKAAKQALRWNKAKNFVLNEEGNFLPYFPARSGASNSNPQDLTASGGNCAKIKCPDIFKPDMVCWECH
jgi:hypothetical protein